MQSHQDAERGLGAGVECRLGQSNAQWGAVAVSALDHRSSRGGHGDVGGGPAGLGARGAKGGDGDVDQAGVDFGERLVADAEGVHGADVGGFNHGVGAAGQFAEPGSAVLRLEVEDDGALAPGVGLPDERVFDVSVVGAVGEGSALAGDVAVRRFDCDHICAEIGEDHAADQAAVVGEVEDSVLAEHVAPPIRICKGRLAKRAAP